MHSANDMIWAMTAMASLGVAAFFLRFWRQTRDRFFALLSLAFALLGLNWTVLAVYDPLMESRHLVYVIRLAAFVLIIAAIVEKNRGGRKREHGGADGDAGRPGGGDDDRPGGGNTS